MTLLLLPQATLANPAAIAAFEQNDLGNAKSLFEKSLQENGNDPVALQYLGRIALREGELDDAEDYIKDALELAPLNAEILFDTANIMGAQAQDSSIFSAPGYAKKSLKAYKKAVELEPETIRFREGLMGFYLGAPGIAGGDDNLALVEAQAIAKLSKSRGFLALANVYQDTDEEEKLEALYVNAEEQFPDNAAILFNRGMYYQSQEKFEMAVADFQKVQGLKPENDEDISLHAALYQIGRSSVLSGESIDQGIKALHSYIETSPLNNNLPSKPWARYRLGLLYAKNGDTQTATTLYEQAKADTKDKTLLKNLKKELKKRR